MALLLTLAAAAGCAADDPTRNDLAGTTWYSAVVNGVPLLPPGELLSIEFAEDTLRAEADCGVVSGTYEVSGEQLVFAGGQVRAPSDECFAPRGRWDRWLVDFLSDDVRIDLTEVDLRMSAGGRALVLVTDPEDPSLLNPHTPTSVTEAEILGPNLLALGVNSCNADLITEVEETPDAVTVTVRQLGSMEDCRDGVEVELDQPLGQRVLLDGHTGDSISVSAR